MDQRVLAFVKVGLWLADCSPVESHPCCIVLLMLNVLRVALSCRFAVVLASPCRVGCRCSVKGSSRCVVVLLSSVCLRRSVLCSMPLLLACFMAAALTLLLGAYAAVLTVACNGECSSRCFVSVSSSRAPCMPLRADGALPCPVAGCGWGVGVGALVTQWSGCLPPGALPSLAGCLAPRGWGCFLVGIKITPRPSSWKVDGVGVHLMLTNSIHPGVTVALPAAPTTSALDLAGRGSASRAGLRV